MDDFNNDDLTKIQADIDAEIEAARRYMPPPRSVIEFTRNKGGNAGERIHPLAQFVHVEDELMGPRWTIPGFIGAGVVVIAGAHGIGKTTALLPLAMTAAGLHGGDLMPREWRHVIYITEDIDQIQRIVCGIVQHGKLGITMEAVRQRVHFVEAVRLDPAYVAAVGKIYREKFTRIVAGVEVLPLVVLDTKSAVLAQENENDNAEASRMMAMLKQGFDGLSIWMVGHVAKADLTRKDVQSSRGAGAVDGDGNQTAFLIKEGDLRYLVLGKKRFESTWNELEIISYTAQATATDEFGNPETVVLRWGIAQPAQFSRKETARQAEQQKNRDDQAQLRNDIRDTVDSAWITGNPLSQRGVRSKIHKKTADVVAMIENLLNEQWLYEVEIPAKERRVNSKSTYLINLNTKEHEEILAGYGPPSAKLIVPPSWLKQAIPLVPKPNGKYR